MNFASHIALTVLLVFTNTVHSQGSIVDTIVEQVEVEASFPGGDKRRVKFIYKERKMPKQVAEGKIRGIVTLNMQINKQGEIDSVVVKEGLDSIVDAEALRIVEEMPNWNPAVKNGEQVSSWVKMEVHFFTKKWLRKRKKRRRRNRRSRYKFHF